MLLNFTGMKLRLISELLGELRTMNPQEIKEECDYYLRGLLSSPNLINKWWTKPNNGFGGKIPEEVFEENPQAVLNYLIKYYDYQG